MNHIQNLLNAFHATRASRREHVTRGADPTVVVTWTLKDDAGAHVAQVTEFQNVYLVYQGVAGTLADAATNTLGEQLHRALEAVCREPADTEEEF